MMADLASYTGVLGPGPYWAENQSATLDWLRRNDLNRFRTYERVDKGLSNFGGGSRWRHPDELRTEQSRVNASLIYRLASRLALAPVQQLYRRRLRDLAREQLAQKMIADLMARLVAARDVERELDRVTASTLGNPSDLFEVGGRSYTPKFIDEFLKYLDMKELVDFSAVATLLEIGPGAGTFAELMAKLDNRRRIYLIDIPPQLYVAERVLEAAFPGEVATYRTIKRNPDVLHGRAYRIFMLAPWQAETAEIGPIDLAFNQVSFSEMTTETVAAYLSLLKRWNTGMIALRAADLRKRNEGPGGDDYTRCLTGYDLLARIPIGAAGRSVGGERTSSAFYFKRQNTRPETRDAGMMRSGVG